MFTVQDDWIEYDTTEFERARLQSATARRVAVRGGAACAQRVPAMRVQHTTVPQRAAARSTGAGSTTPTARPARLRLTRRGRVVLVVIPALLALSGALLAAGPGAAEAAPHTAPRTVVVAEGESLWTIAERIAPHADPRTTVAAIERVNGLHDAQVAAGVVLRLPSD